MLHRLRRGKRAFQETFKSREGEMVLAHLRRFCSAEVTQSPYNSDALAMARMVGRLEVYKEITRFLALSEDAIDEAARRAAQPGGEDG